MLIAGRLEEASLEVLAADPTTGVLIGRMIWNSVHQRPRVQIGSNTWKNFVFPDSNDVLTNKDFDGGTASDIRRITVPKDTLANITALTRKAGTILYATDTGLFYRDNGTTLTALGTTVTTTSPWDEALGAAGPYSLYAAANHTVATAKTYHDVVVGGNLTLSADLVVTGNLWVGGQIIANGFKFDVSGHVVAVGGAAIEATNESMTVRGSVYSGAAWTMKNLGASQPTFSVGGDFLCADDIDMSGTAAAVNVAYILAVGGQLSCVNLTLAGGDSSAGGTVTVGGSLRATDVSLVGGDGVLAAGGNGGALSVAGNAELLGECRTDGGDGASTFNGGVGGAVTIKGSLYLVGDLKTLGGSSAGGGGQGGDGGAISLYGPVSADAAAILSSSSQYDVGNAGAVYLGAGGVLGVVSITGTAPPTFTCDGNLIVKGTFGIASSAYGGDGGVIVIKGNATFEDVLGFGGIGDGNSGSAGTAQADVDGGDGGSLTVHGNLVTLDQLSSSGGSIETDPNENAGGDGGTILVYGNWSASDGPVILNGGDTSDRGALHATGGNGGTVTVHGNFKAAVDYIQARGGHGYTAGSGGEFTFHGPVRIDNFIISGGNGFSSQEVGKLVKCTFWNGGLIEAAWEDTTGGNRSGAGTEWSVSGFLTLGYIEVNGTRYPTGKFTFWPYYSALMQVDSNDGTGGIGTNAGEIPAGAVSGLELCHGKSSSGEWRYKTFDNT